MTQLQNATAQEIADYAIEGIEVHVTYARGAYNSLGPAKAIKVFCHTVDGDPDPDLGLLTPEAIVQAEPLIADFIAGKIAD